MFARLTALCCLFWLSIAASALAQTLSPEALAVHGVNRLSFGPAPGDIDRVRAMGFSAYVEEQLAPEKLPEPQALTDRLAALKTYSMDTVQLFRTYGPKAPGGPRKNPTMDEINAAKGKAAIIHQEAAQAKLWRALLSPRQLEELLCDFWYNHFNVPAGKGLTHLWVGSFEREAIRPFVLGRFEDMLLAVTRHPAMLIHLENWQSASPDSQQGKGKQRPLVEIHARELLTSHTTGLEPGKVKAQDVNSLALILAGWSVGSPRTPQDKNGFVFDEHRHDGKDKIFLGKTIKGAGLNEGLEALHLLATHPETAKNVSTKLARFFLADDPPKALEEALTKVFIDTKGDIRAVLKALFASPEFSDKKYAGTKFKNPLRYVTSMVRASSRPVNEVLSLTEHLNWLGMPLYDAPGASGYKETRDVWLAADAMLKRLNLAAQAGGGGLPCWSPGSYKAVEPLDAKMLAKNMGLTLSPVTGQAVEAAQPGFKAGVLLGSPEGQQY
ncbi:MAG: DUF1800 domain-containing protein [Desulfovibrio sp.]|nr:DUF1800 domain-containing protein [Desulfovibrio sp.]MBI4959466.1 DUF1800 domain-containing protein [Desulfovibrio sp.]